MLCDLPRRPLAEAKSVVAFIIVAVTVRAAGVSYIHGIYVMKIIT